MKDLLKYKSAKEVIKTLKKIHLKHNKRFLVNKNIFVFYFITLLHLKETGRYLWYKNSFTSLSYTEVINILLNVPDITYFHNTKNVENIIWFLLYAYFPDKIKTMNDTLRVLNTKLIKYKELLKTHKPIIEMIIQTISEGTIHPLILMEHIADDAFYSFIKDLPKSPKDFKDLMEMYKNYNLIQRLTASVLF